MILCSLNSLCRLSHSRYHGLRLRSISVCLLRPSKNHAEGIQRSVALQVVPTHPRSQPHCLWTDLPPRLPPIIARTVSTSPSPQPGPLKRGWRYFISVVKSFVAGSKLFVADIRKARALKAKMSGFAISETKEGNEVKWEDVRFIYQTVSSTKRVLPTLALFWIPFIGYAAPFIALFFPGQLLSEHFWSEKQKADILKKQFDTRKSKLNELDALVSDKQTELNIRLKEAIVSDDSEWLIAINNKLIENKANIVSYQQMRLLCEVWGVSSIIPLSWWRARKLRRHIAYIFTIDHLISNQDINGINIQTIKELMVERSVFTNKSDNALLKQFERWLQLTTSFKAVPYILVAHLPLVMKWKHY